MCQLHQQTQVLTLTYLGGDMKYLSLLFLILLISCKGQPNQLEQQSSKTSDEKPTDFSSNEIDNNSAVVENAIGILVTSESYQFGDTISVYDEKQNLFIKLVRADESQVIALKCLTHDKRYFQVELDNNGIGLIPRNSTKVMLQTWEEHILSLFSVGFDEQKNPLLKEPSLSAEQLYYDQDEFYHPTQIKGEWLQVKWGSEENWNYGWIKWKDKDKLLIELFYFA
jgi:hypothetical protein